MVDLELVGVRFEVMGNTPVIVLRERTGDRRVLPIYIGTPEAQSILWAVEGRVPERPLTHDLLVNVLGALGAVLERVLITEVSDGVFLAEMMLQTRSGPVNVPCRPSDGVAVAVRVGCPIACEPNVIDEAGRFADLGSEGDDEGDETALLGEFRDFIENINPDDFKP
jgi:bifunctional DNase/RNase